MKKNMVVTIQTPKTETHEDKLTAAIGKLGKWQIYLFIILSIPIKMTASWTQLSIIFLSPKTTFRCTETNSTMDIENSTCYADCVSYEYFTEFENTIISQWHLICDRAWLVNFTQTLCMFGVLVGSITFGFIADRFGRRTGILIASTLHVILSFVVPFCPDYWSFTIVRFFLGASTAGLMATSFVFLMEIIGPSKRELMNISHHFPMAIGEMAMPLFSYYLRSWDKFSIGIAVPNIVLLSYFFVAPESPKWLISVGRLEAASAVMTKAAECNKLPSDNMLDVAKSIASENHIDPNTSHRRASYIDLFKYPSLRTKILCCCCCWFVLGLGFYGGNQYIGQTSSNVFVAIVAAGALQIPGQLIGGYLSKRIGRRSSVISFLMVNAVSNAILTGPNDAIWFYIKLVAGAVSVGTSGGGFAIMYMYTTELFPTVARNMAMGASSTASRVGSMLAPFIAGLSYELWIAPVILAIAPTLAAGACYCLPETKGKKLADVLDT